MDHPTVSLTDEPWHHPHVFAAAFNTGDPDEVEHVYESDGVLVERPGHAVVAESRRAANAALMDLGLPIEVAPRHVYVNGDLALMIVDWKMIGTARDGQYVEITGTATDVARKGDDGYWRYVIDNPWGHASPAV